MFGYMKLNENHLYSVIHMMVGKNENV